MALRKTHASKIEARALRVGRNPNARDVKSVLSWLERHGTRATRDGMARYGIPSTQAFGIPVGALRRYAKTLGPDHELAAALWGTGWYEARMLAVFVEDPALLTSRQMDAWCRDFDSWAICDTACFHLFDRSPHAHRKLVVWAKRQGEFMKRAAFALLASLSVHDKQAPDESFLTALALIEAAACDSRNFVKKSVNWALRSIGKRNLALNAAAVEVARRLAASEDATERWVGKDALRELASEPLRRRLAARAASVNSARRR